MEVMEVMEEMEVKTDEEVEDERKLVELERFKARMERLRYVRRESQLEMQIALAERQQGNLSDYEKMRLSNMKERLELLERLQFDKEKKEMLEERQKARIFTPKKEVVKRAPSVRLKAKQEQGKVEEAPISHQGLSWQLRLQCLGAQQRRQSPGWVGQWVPLNANKGPCQSQTLTFMARDITSGRAAPRFVHPASDSKSFIPFETIYKLEEVAQSCRVPQVEVRLGEVLEQHTKLHTTLGVLDSFSAEVRDVVEEARYSTSRPLVGMELVEESVVVDSTITALASSWDLVGYGCTSGTVGLHIGATSLNWRPHGSAVTTVTFQDTSLLP